MEKASILLGKNLQEHRNKILKVTQSEASERVGISLRYFQQIEKGESWPSIDVFESICQKLEVNPWDLLKEPPPVSPTETTDPISLEAIGRMLQETASYVKETTALQSLYEDKIKLLEGIIRDQEAENKALNEKLRIYDKIVSVFTEEGAIIISDMTTPQARAAVEQARPGWKQAHLRDKKPQKTMKIPHPAARRKY